MTKQDDVIPRPHEPNSYSKKAALSAHPVDNYTNTSCSEEAKV